MQQTIRGTGSRVNVVVVGPMVILLGVGAGITAIVLSIVLQNPAYLGLFFPAVLALGGGAFVMWGARRSRLQVDEHGATWSGFVGAKQSLRWDQVHRLLPPPAGTSRTVAIAQLRDGSRLEVRALWESPTSPGSLMGATDHSEAQNALLAAHRGWLAAHR